MGVLERLEEQRRYEIHQRKLARTRNVVKTQEREKKLPKKFDPDTLATANRQRAPRSPGGDVDDYEPLQAQDGNRRVSSAARRKQAKAASALAQPRERAATT